MGPAEWGDTTAPMEPRDLVLALVLGLCACVLPFWFQSGLRSSADGSSYAFSLALARDGSATIERTLGYTAEIDYALVDGRAYTDRAPGVSVFGAPFLALGRSLAHWCGAELVDDRLDEGTELRLGEVLPISDAGVRGALFVSLAAHALTVAALFVLGRRLGGSRFASALTAGAYGVATLSIKYAAVFFTHGLGTAFLTLASLALFDSARVDRPQPARLAAIGFLLGCLPTVEYATLVLVPVALVATFAAGGARLLRNPRVWVYGALGAAIPVLGAAVFDTIHFGAPWSISYSFNHKFPWARSPAETFIVPLSEGLGGLFFDGKNEGLFASSPFLLFAAAGFFLLWRRRPRAGLYVTLVAGAYLVLVGKHRTWWGGGTSDPRYLMPVIPLLTLPLVFAVDWIRERRDLALRAALGTLLGLLLAISFLINVFELRLFVLRPWFPSLSLRGGFFSWLADFDLEPLRWLPLEALCAAPVLALLALILRALRVEALTPALFRRTLMAAAVLAVLALAILAIHPDLLPGPNLGKPS